MNEKIKCQKCDGSGKIVCNAFPYFPHPKECRSCYGEPDFRSDCPACEGEGEVKSLAD